MGLFGSSGIRAVFDKDLLNLAFRVGLAVGGKYGRVVVGRDTRTSGDAMKHVIISGLLTAGARCYDAGITPTPTLAYVTREFDVGIMITASHNPPEYNGLKLFNPDGSSFGISQQTQIEEFISGDSSVKVDWAEISNSDICEGAISRHIDAIISQFKKPVKVKVVVDAGGGAASEVTPRLLEKLGCEVIRLYCHPTGVFPRGIEPSEANLKDLCHLVKESGAAVGIAHDGDADRLMVVDERGRYIPGDKLLVILARALMAKEVVTTLDTSITIETLGFEVRRTRIGDTWVSEELKKGGDFGGETSGAWIFPQISLCPDGIYAAARIAAVAAKQQLCDLADAVPVYPLRRGSVETNGMTIAMIESGLTALKPLSISRLDGLKLDFTDGWLLIRPSGTESKIRLTAEAKTAARAQQLYDAGLAVVRSSINNGRSQR